jgi:hypothetical protein
LKKKTPGGLKVPFGGTVHRHKVLLPEKKEVQKVALRSATQTSLTFYCWSTKDLALYATLPIIPRR